MAPFLCSEEALSSQSPHRWSVLLQPAALAPPTLLGQDEHPNRGYMPDTEAYDGAELPCVAGKPTQPLIRGSENDHRVVRRLQQAYAEHTVGSG